MGQVYIIPDIQKTEQSLSLIKEYNGAFEYNDFWQPEVLGNIRKQEEIIEHYAKYRTDFSSDTMHGAFLDVNVHSEDPLIREVSVQRIKQSMEIAKRMGLRGVVFHTGILAGCRLDTYFKHWKEANAEFYLELAAEYPNQEILIENMFDETPEEIAGLAEMMKNTDNFGICLDYSHGALTNCSVENWVRELAPYIRHMHINDNDLYRDLHQQPGMGKIDWQEYNRLMQLYDINSSVLVEVKGYEKQRKSLEYLKNNGIFPL